MKSKKSQTGEGEWEGGGGVKKYSVLDDVIYGRSPVGDGKI